MDHCNKGNALLKISQLRDTHYSESNHNSWKGNTAINKVYLYFVNIKMHFVIKNKLQS